ncbi:MAG: SAM-dependent methyltransferase [Nannocystaceae bacterium]
MAIDTSKPHIGRIYDFMLGGHHNYEVDRQAAAAILKIVPTYPKWARANRWFLQMVASEWQTQGVERVLDLGTGLPTEGHFNDILPDAQILFTDNDEVSVAYGEEMLRERPTMAYRCADIANPETLIKAMSGFFGDDRVIAIGCIGLAYMVPDAALIALFRALHEWSRPGSVMAVTYGAGIEGAEGQADASLEAFRRQAGVQMHVRSHQGFAALAAPWRLRETKSLPEWLGVPDMFSDEEMRRTGGYLAGAYFER